MGLSIGTGLGGSGLVDLAFMSGLGGTGLQKQAGISIRKGLVGEWPFDEGTGNTAADKSAGGNDIDLTGAGSWITGGFDFGTAALITTITASTLGVNGSTGKTIVTVYKTGGLAAQLGIEFSVAVPSNGERYTWRHASATDSHRLEIGGEGFTETALNDDDDTNWHFGAVKTSGSTLSTSTLFRDAQSQAATGTTITINTGATAVLRLNSLVTVAGATDLGYLLIYSRALTNAEIDTLRSELTVIMAGRGVTLP